MSHNVIFQIPMSTNGGSQVMAKKKRKPTSEGGPSEPEGKRGLSPSSEAAPPPESLPTESKPEPPPAPEQPRAAEPAPVEGPSATTSDAETTADASTQRRKDKGKTKRRRPGSVQEVLDSTVIARPLLDKLRIAEKRHSTDPIKIIIDLNLEYPDGRDAAPSGLRNS